jgi:uncharacterized protein (TIGR03437 family)
MMKSLATAKNVLVLALLGAAAAMAASSANLLGVDYSEWLPAGAPATQIATDTSGAIYLLMDCPLSPPTGLTNFTSCVTKLYADGKTMLWQDVLGFQASAMAVTPSGDVFVIPTVQSSETSLYVAKLGAAGSGIAWQAPAGSGFLFFQSFPPVLAADSQGRTYVAAPYSGTTTLVVRLNAAGSGIDYTATVTGLVASIGADGSGAAVVAGPLNSGTGVFVTRVAPDGSTAYSTVLPQSGAPALALDASGNAAVLVNGVLSRLNSTGAVTVSTSVVGVGSQSQFALDSAGNAYVLGVIGQLYPVSNSLATCLPGLQPDYPVGEYGQVTSPTQGTAPLLTEVAPDGSIQQITYVPGAAINSTLILGTGPNSTVFVAASQSNGFVPTQEGPFPPVLPSPPIIPFLLRLSPRSGVQTVSLACVGSAATYFIWPVAPGEIVTLIGNGLGPQQGIATQATLQSPFPTEVSGVEATFDGTPAPLLWVQNSQINAVVPWSLAPGQNTQICVFSAAAVTETNCLTWPVAQTAPAVFTVDGSHAAALNQDGTANSAMNPAAPGSIVSVFATGLGPINPPQAGGALIVPPLPANVLSVSVEGAIFEVQPPPIGLVSIPVPLPVTYAGPAPYLVSGASQINFQIPPGGGQLHLALPATGSQYFSQYFTVYTAGQ